ncbi:MAG: NAD(P)H-hydrate dehydratase [bacterium]|nr:NAD(P)H-hydrate dehydratase [bacterium]
MDVLTNARMQKVDADTINRFYPGLELMERAGRKVAEFILTHFPKEGFKASIFVGPGNNGGDALVVARYLAEEERACSIHLLSDPEKFTMDGFKNYKRLKGRMSKHRTLVEINATRPDWAALIRKDFIDATLIVDGLFGTGLSRDLEERAAETVGLINDSGLPAVSLDTPSGLHGDTGRVLGCAVRADTTITMGYPKLGMLFYPGKEYVGDLIVADLGFPDEVLEVHSLGVYLLDQREAARRLPARAPDAHKYRNGTVVLVSGSREYTGATLLAAEAALRSGCGMVYAAVPESIRSMVEPALRELITFPVPETSDGTIGSGALETLKPYVEKADVLIIGPGLGRNDETAQVVRDLVTSASRRVVLDADGIGAFNGKSELLESVSSPLVLTPHSGELQRLLSVEIPREPLERIEMTREVAKTLGATLVHKGSPTLIANADGLAWVNHNGNSALATAGSGDVLTGLVGGIMAQGANTLDGACVACHVHGRAGELASEFLGVRGVIAGDVMDMVGEALRDLEDPSLSYRK